MEIYVVKQRDTLYSIAEMFGKNVNILAEQNGLSIEENLVVGQTVVIPQDGSKIGKLAVNGYLYPNINLETLTKTLPYLTFVTIFTYGFNEQGELTNLADEEIINIAKEYGVAPIMLVSTLTDEGKFSNFLANRILNDETAQNTLIQNILNNIKQKGYYGLDIDFEYILAEDREAYGNFIKKVSTVLNSEGYPVIVALAPKTSATQQGLLYESHDYGVLGQNANAVLLMTYEWGYTY